MALGSRFHQTQPCGLTDFFEVAGALGENRLMRHPFFAGQPITSATVNVQRDKPHCLETGMIAAALQFSDALRIFLASAVVQRGP
jgi:hypothetical protein